MSQLRWCWSGMFKSCLERYIEAETIHSLLGDFMSVPAHLSAPLRGLQKFKYNPFAYFQVIAYGSQLPMQFDCRWSTSNLVLQYSTGIVLSWEERVGVTSWTSPRTRDESIISSLSECDSVICMVQISHMVWYSQQMIADWLPELKKTWIFHKCFLSSRRKSCSDTGGA